MKLSRTEVDSSRRLAWAFTRLIRIGFPNTSEGVSEVDCSRFLSISVIQFINKVKILPISSMIK